MEAKEFLTENSDWFDKSPGGEKLYFESEVIRMMEEYAKHIIEINFCDGSPIEFEKLSVDQLKKIHDNVSKCVDWVNS